jgi:hypothetical protein
MGSFPTTPHSTHSQGTESKIEIRIPKIPKIRKTPKNNPEIPDKIRKYTNMPPTNSSISTNMPPID